MDLKPEPKPEPKSGAATVRERSPERAPKSDLIKLRALHAIHVAPNKSFAPGELFDAPEADEEVKRLLRIGAVEIVVE